jgi:hypothetical protein
MLSEFDQRQGFIDGEKALGLHHHSEVTIVQNGIAQGNRNIIYLTSCSDRR